jgi:hypothetical protein
VLRQEKTTDLPVRVHFVFHNNHHYFDTAAVAEDDIHLELALPDKIYKNRLRKHERMEGRDKVFMRFKILVKTEKKDLEALTLRDERVLLQELGKPKPSIEKILGSIKGLVSDFSQNFQVKLFKADDSLTLEEELLRGTGRIFLISDSFEDSIEKKQTDEVVSVHEALAYLVSRGVSKAKATGELLDLLQQKRNDSIYSECFIPLKLEGAVVGYIRLNNDVNYRRSIKPVNALRAAGYGSILVEALVKYDYFTLSTGSECDIPVENISAGGALFRLEDQKLKKYLTLNTLLQMSVCFPSRQIEVSGSVHRIDHEQSVYGVEFLQINEVDAKYIEKAVHTVFQRGTPPKP